MRRNSPITAPPPPLPPPRTPDEAEQRFWRRYGPALLKAVLLDAMPQTLPTTVAEWLDLAVLTRDVLRQPTNERIAAMLDAAAAKLRKEL